MHRKTDWGPGWCRSRAARLWAQVGAADVHRRMRLDGPGTREETLAGLQRGQDVGGVLFDAELHDAGGLASAHAARPPYPAPWHTRALGLAGMVVGAAEMLFGWVLAGLGPG
ncbi:hypothetical protein [Streptomyces pseudovenezuelae]|uniref:hypothetical protein n=1 Tax=Streptomyces pseudovenezuelae TaxID=67350 RepID=UPI002E328129|nr:hypothetical protein [Streptomyces pseudovenezuelae]